MIPNISFSSLLYEGTSAITEAEQNIKRWLHFEQCMNMGEQIVAYSWIPAVILQSVSVFFSLNSYMGITFIENGSAININCKA